MTRGEGVKNRDFYGDILFEWPHGHCGHISLIILYKSFISRRSEDLKIRRSKEYLTSVFLIANQLPHQNYKVFLLINLVTSMCEEEKPRETS